jgi:hypothetical protein
MNTKKMAAVAAVISTIVVTGVANAEEKDQAQSESKQSLAAPKNSVELTIGTGYTQGFGQVGSGQPSLTDLGTAGGSIQGGVGYRISPEIALGVYGSWGMFGRGDKADPTGNLYTATAGGEVIYHIIPKRSEFDPWMSLGTGWRGYWMTGDVGTTSMHGWEIAKLQVGVDYRVDKYVAVGPVVGADITTFFTQSTPQTGSFQNIDSPKVDTFLFAGLQGRFDIPTSSDKSSQVAKR